MSEPSLPDFLGKGWAFPLVTRGERFASAAGADKIRQSILLILQTAPGERVMMPEFGCRLNELLFAGVNGTSCSLAQVYVKQALDRWEPRIALSQVSAVFDPLVQACMLVSVDYVILARNQPANLVYPFYLNQSKE
jgi:phage baseplate assembly protein W